MRRSWLAIWALCSVGLVGLVGCSTDPLTRSSECNLGRRFEALKAELGLGANQEFQLQDGEGMTIYRFQGLQDLSLSGPKPNKEERFSEGLVIVRGRAVVADGGLVTRLRNLEVMVAQYCQGFEISESTENDGDSLFKIRRASDSLEASEIAEGLTISIGSGQRLPPVTWEQVCIQGALPTSPSKDLSNLKPCPPRKISVGGSGGSSDSDDTLVRSLGPTKLPPETVKGFETSGVR
jgi:hypothetical protein